MSNTSEWAVTAGANNSAPPNGWPENMQRSAVNDCARELMAALARWYQDARGSLITTGGTTAYALATNNANTALSDIPLMAVRFNIANTGASTLNVDGLGALAITSNGSAVTAGQLSTSKLYLIAYNPGIGGFEILGPTPPATVTPEFLSGTVMIFAQTAAPTGWTKGATHDNKALRVVTGAASSGGSTPFTSVFASRTLTQANLPNVSLSSAGLIATVTDPGHTHSYTRPTNDHVTSITGGQQTSDAGTGATTGSSTTGITVAMSGNISLGGSGTAVDFAVQYVDVILATKN